MSDGNRIRDEFRSHRLTTEQLTAVEGIRTAFSRLLDSVESLTPKGRPHSIGVTKLQEACMFMVRAVCEEGSK